MEQYAGLESTISHVARVLSGVEALHEEIKTGTDFTVDAKYADEVLKLHEIDLPSLVGTEGFIDGLKLVAKKGYEWIKQILKAIRDFFFGIRGKRVDEAIARLPETIKSANENTVFKEAEKRAEGKATTAQENILTLQEFTGKGDTEGASEKEVRDLARRLSLEERKFISDELAAVTKDPEIRQKVIHSLDQTATRIYERAESKLESAVDGFSRIAKIDPEGRSLKALGVNDFVSIIKDTKEILKGVQGVNLNNLGDVSSKVIKARNETYKLLQKVTKALEAANDQVDKDPESELAPILSRMVSIVGVITDISVMYDNVILTMDGGLNTGIKKATDNVVKEAIKAAREKMGDSVSAAVNNLNAAF